MRMTARQFAACIAPVLVLALTGCPPFGGNGNGNGDPDPALLEMELDAFDQINAARTGNGVAALIMDDTAREVARAHSQDMADRDFFDHVNPDGDDPFERMADAGISFGTAGENIAANQGFPDPPTTAVNGWLNSPGHFANIMNGGFTHTGMGVAENNVGKFYFTQVFFAPAKAGQSEIRVFYTVPIEQIAD